MFARADPTPPECSKTEYNLGVFTVVLERHWAGSSRKRTLDKSELIMHSGTSRFPYLSTPAVPGITTRFLPSIMRVHEPLICSTQGKRIDISTLVPFEMLEMRRSLCPKGSRSPLSKTGNPL